MKILNALILSVVFLLSSAGTALAAGGHDETAEMEQQIDGYLVKLTFIDGHAVLGHNEVHVGVLDPQGQPVADAVISIVTELYPASSQASEHAGMDMGGANHDMGSMGKPLKTAKVNLTAASTGEFEGEVELDQPGTWMLNVVVGLQPQMKSVMFPVDLVKSGPNWYVLGGFLILFVSIIVVGGLTKRKAHKVLVPEVAV